MQWLADLCVRRPVFATVLSLLVVMIGVVFYTKLGVDQFPKVDFPVVVVSTSLPGSSPEDVEREITDKIEGAVNTIGGIDELRSNSSEGLSQVIVQFQLEKDVDVAQQEVQQKINLLLPELPRGIDPPMVVKFDPDATPILYIALQAPGRDIKEITDLADRVVRRRLESVNGVGQVLVLGGRKRQINVDVDPVKLRGLGISPTEVAAAIAAQNVTLPGGRVDTSKDYLSVRVEGRVRSVDSLKAIVVREQNGRAVRLDEVADVTDGVTDADTAALWNGEPTVLLSVRKQSGTNTLQVADSVFARMKDIQKELPSGYRLEVQRDGSAVIRTGTDAVKEHLVLGALFAALIVLFFLGNLRSTVIAAVAIPTSIIGTFALMKLQGYTLNTITLLALALAVGIVIDDAIVVLENIFKHIEEKGQSPFQAAIEGTREIGMPVLATTLSLIAVFLPIAFIGGIPGRFLGSFGVTMAFSIAVSLFVSFTLTPSLASRWLRSKSAERTWIERLSDVVYRPVERAYGRLLALLMRRRWIVVVASALVLVATGPLAMKARKGFLPVDDRAQFEIIVRLPEGRSVASTELVGERVARLVRGIPEVAATLVTVGDDPAKTPNQARVFVKLVPPDRRRISQNQLQELVRQRIVPTLPPDLRVSVQDVSEFGGGQSTARIQYLLAGPDLEALERETPKLVERIKALPGAVDVDSSLVVGKPELGVFVDRDRAADLGVQVADVAQALQFLVAGQKVSTYEEGGESYDVRLRATSQFRTSADALQLLTVPSRKVGVVSLADVVRVVPGTGPSTIQRYQRQRQVTFLANPAPGVDEGALGASIRQVLESSNLPRGFTVQPQGQTKVMGDTARSFGLGLLASLVFMYLILAAQFESWLHPVTILLSLPLTIPFAVASVILFGQALDIFSFLGIFVLFGVVKKNAILQIDRTNKLLPEYGVEEARTPAERRERLTRAILHANRDRLRPILMTTLAFVAGMLPLVLARGIGSGYNRATAGVVVGGQSLSLLLTLVAVPVAYSFFDQLSYFVRRKRGARGPAEVRVVGATEAEDGLEAGARTAEAE